MREHLMNPLQGEVQAFHTSVQQGRAPNHTAQAWASPHLLSGETVLTVNLCPKSHKNIRWVFRADSGGIYSMLWRQ